jgi:selenium metabolism protein YedF
MPLDDDLLLVLKGSEIGDGEPDLGAKLMKAFLKTLWDSGRVPARILCMNSAVFLTTEGSPVESILAEFENAGARVLSCGTCLAYYGREDKLVVGAPTSMSDTVEAMLTYGKVIAP